MREKLLGILLLAISCALLFSACSGESNILDSVNVIGTQSSDSESDDITVYPVVISEDDDIPEAVDGVLYFQRPGSSGSKSERRSSSSIRNPFIEENLSSSSRSPFVIVPNPEPESSSSLSLVILESSSSERIIQSSSSVAPSSSSVIPSSSSNEWDWNVAIEEYLNPDIIYKTMVDPRDGQKYYIVKIANRWWMAQNLNYNAENIESWCYGNESENCDVLGRLYSWDAAIDACPEGWHLPSTSEWVAVIDSAGGNKNAGRILKSKVGWFTDLYGNDGNGTDSLGFSAIPAGWRSTDGEYDNLGSEAYFWVFEAGVYADYMSMYYADRIERSFHYKTMGFSVRCIENLKE